MKTKIQIHANNKHAQPKPPAPTSEYTSDKHEFSQPSWMASSEFVYTSRRQGNWKPQQPTANHQHLNYQQSIRRGLCWSRSQSIWWNIVGIDFTASRSCQCCLSCWKSTEQCLASNPVWRPCAQDREPDEEHALHNAHGRRILLYQ